MSSPNIFPSSSKAFDLDRLLTTLNVSGIQTSNPPLYQVISQLLNAVRAFQNATNTSIAGNSTDITALEGRTYLTVEDETVVLPNSRQLLAGDGIEFDDSIASERTISSDRYPSQLGFTGL